MFEDIQAVLNQLDGLETLNTRGKMDQKGRIRPLGLMMSNIGRWLREEKSYEITGVSILLSIVFLCFMSGVLANAWFNKRRYDVFYFEKKGFRMSGIALVPGYQDVYIPVYKEVQ